MKFGTFPDRHLLWEHNTDGLFTPPRSFPATNGPSCREFRTCGTGHIPSQVFRSPQWYRARANSSGPKVSSPTNSNSSSTSWARPGGPWSTSRGDGRAITATEPVTVAQILQASRRVRRESRVFNSIKHTTTRTRERKRWRGVRGGMSSSTPELSICSATIKKKQVPGVNHRYTR